MRVLGLAMSWLWLWHVGFDLFLSCGGCTFQILGVSGSEDRGGGDNSIQFVNIGREGDKSFKKWRRKVRMEGRVTTVF